MHSSNAREVKRISAKDLCIEDRNGDLLEFKGADFKTMTFADRLYMAKSNKIFKEPGISYDELVALHTGFELAGNSAMNIVETGMCFGTTTRYFATQVAKYGGKLTSIELKPRQIFIDQAKEIGLWQYINMIEGDAQKIPWSDKIQFLYIDSEHAISDALGEYMRYRVFLTSNSYVAFHDTDMCYGVKRAIEIILEMDNLELIAESSDRKSAGLKVFKVIGLGQNQFRILQKMRDEEAARNRKSRAEGAV